MKSQNQLPNFIFFPKLQHPTLHSPFLQFYRYLLRPHPYTTISVHQFCGKNKKKYLLPTWTTLQFSTLRRSAPPDCSII